MHTVFQITQHTALSVSGLHSRWKICKYALQNGLAFTPASISLLQPRFPYCVLSTVCKTSFKDRKRTKISFLTISYIHNRWSGSGQVIHLYSNFQTHKWGWGVPLYGPYLWPSTVYKKILIFMHHIHGFITLLSCPTPPTLYSQH